VSRNPLEYSVNSGCIEKLLKVVIVVPTFSSIPINRHSSESTKSLPILLIFEFLSIVRCVVELYSIIL